jgi:hypothetical protein
MYRITSGSQYTAIIDSLSLSGTKGRTSKRSVSIGSGMGIVRSRVGIGDGDGYARNNGHRVMLSARLACRALGVPGAKIDNAVAS